MRKELSLYPAEVIFQLCGVALAEVAKILAVAEFETAILSDKMGEVESNRGAGSFWPDKTREVSRSFRGTFSRRRLDDRSFACCTFRMGRGFRDREPA
jgi:hypothetical protein